MSLLLATARPAGAQRVIPSLPVRSGTLSFDASATLGDFTGSTTTMSGSLVGGNDLRDARGWVEAPVATLTTGNGMRDKDLNKVMETGVHRSMRFDLLGVSVQHEAGDSAAVTLSGRFTIHGVSRDVAVPATVHFGIGEVRLRSRFPLNVRDYGVTDLSRFLVFKMNPNITVTVDVVFGAAGPPADGPASTPPPSA